MCGFGGLTGSASVTGCLGTSTGKSPTPSPRPEAPGLLPTAPSPSCWRTSLAAGSHQEEFRVSGAVGGFGGLAAAHWGAPRKERDCSRAPTLARAAAVTRDSSCPGPFPASGTFLTEVTVLHALFQVRPHELADTGTVSTLALPGQEWLQPPGAGSTCCSAPWASLHLTAGHGARGAAR